MQDWVNVHLKLTIDGHEVEAAVPVPLQPSPRRVLLPILQRLTDTIVSIGERNGPSPVSCRKGCDACCRQMVPISPTEAYALAARIEAMPPERANALLQRFDQAWARLDDMGLLERLERRHELSLEQQRALDRDYFRAQIACPFLEEQACSIHGDRPLACREFLVTSPAEHCLDPTADKVSQLPLATKVSLALAANDQAPWLPLVLARVYVAQHPERLAEASPQQLLQAILQSL